MPFIIAIATLAGLVWGTWFLLRGSLLAGCLIFLVTACCFSHTFLEFDLGPLPLTLDRVAVVLLVGAYVVQRRLGTAEPKRLLTVDWLVLALAAVLAISTFTHDWRVSRPGEISPVWRLLFGYLMPMALYWVARQSPLNERRLGFRSNFRASECGQAAHAEPPAPTNGIRPASAARSAFSMGAGCSLSCRKHAAALVSV